MRLKNSNLGCAQMNYMDIDHHRQYSQITLMDDLGEVIKSGKVANYRSEVEKFLVGIRDIETVVEAGRSKECEKKIKDIKLILIGRHKLKLS